MSINYIPVGITYACFVIRPRFEQSKSGVSGVPRAQSKHSAVATL